MGGKGERRVGEAGEALKERRTKGQSFADYIVGVLQNRARWMESETRIVGGERCSDGDC